MKLFLALGFIFFCSSTKAQENVPMHCLVQAQILKVLNTPNNHSSTKTKTTQLLVRFMEVNNCGAGIQKQYEPGDRDTLQWIQNNPMPQAKPTQYKLKKGHIIEADMVQQLALQGRVHNIIYSYKIINQRKHNK